MCGMSIDGGPHLPLVPVAVSGTDLAVVCRCGYRGPVQPDAARALRALEATHDLTPPWCWFCGRDTAGGRREDRRWAGVRVVPTAFAGVVLGCADDRVTCFEMLAHSRTDVVVVRESVPSAVRPRASCASAPLPSTQASAPEALAWVVLRSHWSEEDGGGLTSLVEVECCCDVCQMSVWPCERRRLDRSARRYPSGQAAGAVAARWSTAAHGDGLRYWAAEVPVLVIDLTRRLLTGSPMQPSVALSVACGIAARPE